MMFYDVDLTYVVYILDDIYSNPFGVWNFSGSPPTPSDDLFREMRNFEVELSKVF